MHKFLVLGNKKCISVNGVLFLIQIGSTLLMLEDRLRDLFVASQALEQLGITDDRYSHYPTLVTIYNPVVDRICALSSA